MPITTTNILHHQTYILFAVLRFVLILLGSFLRCLRCLLKRPPTGAVSGAVEEKEVGRTVSKNHSKRKYYHRGNT